MNLKNKVISLVSAFSMLASICAVTTVNAEGEELQLKVTEVTNETVTIDYVISGVTSVNAFNADVQFDADVIDATSDPVASCIVTAPTAPTTSIYDGNKYGLAAANAADVTVGDDGVVASVTFKLKADVETPVEFKLLKAEMGNKSGLDLYYEEGQSASNFTVASATVYPTVEVTDITAADPVYTGKNVNLTAVVDATKLGDRVLTWSATNGTVTADTEDSTKAVLVPEADGEVVVTVTVDNNGTEATKEVKFTATTKPEPKPYTITTTAVSNGETTITVAADDEYVYEGEETAPAYKLVAQFYSTGNEANSWVSIECEAGASTVTVGAQNATKVSVTAYDEAGNVVGQN